MNFWSNLHTAICQTLQQEIPTIKTCVAYPILRKTIPAPAVLIEMTGFEPIGSVGTEQIIVAVHFEARIVVDALVKDAHVLIRSLAADVMRIVHLNTWGMTVSPAQFTHASPDGFKPELDAYVVWQVSWSHDVEVGESVWDTPELTPHLITIGDQIL